MSLAIGTQLGSYQIVAAIGAGAMGEVYKGRDARLGRDVAIKVLPASWADDPDRLARFEREARLLASLNHPNIGAIYGLEEGNGVRGLVLELIDGDTLAEQLWRGTMPVGDALRAAGQIVAALEAAHRRDIVHRDLKPANIKVTLAGTVKILDFGLATTSVDHPAGPADSTQALGQTRDGVVLGTVPYMSPEQARGKPVGTQADIWAFGCVLYEMLTGRRAFRGETTSDVIAAILERDPDWAALPASVPPALRRLLHKCLQKDAGRRLRNIGDAEFDLVEASSPAVSDPGGERGTGSRIPAAIAIGLVGASLGAAGIWIAFRSGKAAEPAAVTRLILETPLTAPLRSGGRTLAMSPDGTTLVYVGAMADSQLYVRSFDAFEPRPLEGTRGASAPFFSPDGKSIAFFADGTLKRISTIGGPITKICDMPENTRGGSGGTWGASDVIVFAVNEAARAGLFRVPAGGGVPALVVKPDPKDEGGLRDPAFIPGTLAIVFGTYRSKAGVPTSILVRDLDSGNSRTLVSDASRPVVTTTGHLLYLAGASVHATPFSVPKLDVNGPAVPVIDNVSGFDVSASGRIVYTTMGSPQGAGHLTWVDRHGAETPLRDDALYSRPRLSPDNSKLVMEIVDGTKSDIAVFTFSSNTVQRLTTNGNGNSPYWHPDGKRVVYRSSRNLFIQSADGTGTASVFLDSADRALSQTSSLAPGAFSRDGLLYAFVVHGSAETAADIWTLREGPDRSIQPLVQRRGDQWGVRISPDTHWVSYASDEGPRFELNVSSLAPGGGRFQVSNEGGGQGVWSPTGSELFYRTGDRMMAVPYVPGAERPFGKPEEVFRGRYADTALPDYDVTLDGKRFVMVKPLADDAERLVIRVISGFLDDLKRRAPVGGSAR